jgi:hypothetical protein
VRQRKQAGASAAAKHDRQDVVHRTTSYWFLTKVPH